MIHLVVPMSGRGQRFLDAGHAVPKPLVRVGDEPMIARLLACFPPEWRAHFVASRAHEDSALPALLSRLRPGASVRYVAPHGQGPLLPIEAVLDELPDDDAVFVSYCDYGMVWDPRQFERFVRYSACDACVVTYSGFHPHYLRHDAYAYCRLDGERVVELREKGWFTEDREREHASAGGYYFRSATLLREAARHQRALDLQLGGEFYTSLTVEALLRLRPQAQVRVFEVPAFFQWGTPEDLERFEYWERTFAAYNRTAGAAPGTVAQVLMPMAGAGSRFHGVSPLPKPFLAVDGVPMYRRALASLPRPERAPVLVGLRSFTPRIGVEERAEWVLLEATPPGQALSVLAGAAALRPDQPVVVSSCDHAIVLDAATWNAFTAAPDCDAAVCTVRGFPGTTDAPAAYSYVVPRDAADASPFPEVARVALKHPLSDRPARDPLLVGTFWFARASDLVAALEALLTAAEPADGEIHFDPVVNVLCGRGARVRMIPLDGYLNFGDPDSLAQALYYYEALCARRAGGRPRLPGTPAAAPVAPGTP